MRAWMRERQQAKTRSSPDGLCDIPLANIDRVTFFKRDEITTDLICCEIVSPGQVQTFHEEMPVWDVCGCLAACIPATRDCGLRTLIWHDNARPLPSRAREGQVQLAEPGWA